MLPFSLQSKTRLCARFAGAARMFEGKAKKGQICCHKSFCPRIKVAKLLSAWQTAAPFSKQEAILVCAQPAGQFKPARAGTPEQLICRSGKGCLLRNQACQPSVPICLSYSSMRSCPPNCSLSQVVSASPIPSWYVTSRNTVLLDISRKPSLRKRRCEGRLLKPILAMNLLMSCNTCRLRFSPLSIYRKCLPGCQSNGGGLDGSCCKKFMRPLKQFLILTLECLT